MFTYINVFSMFHLDLVKQPQFLDSASSAAAPSGLKVGESSLSDSSPSMRSPQSHPSPAQQTALKVTHTRAKRFSRCLKI